MTVPPSHKVDLESNVIQPDSVTIESDLKPSTMKGLGTTVPQRRV
jgi:hypothetical protein